MIIWSGLGFLVVIIGIGSLVLAQWLTGIVFQDPNYYSANSWPKIAGLVLAAILTWLLSLALNKQAGRELVDPETGQRIVLRRQHSFFFIPVQYWVLVFIGLAVIAFFVW